MTEGNTGGTGGEKPWFDGFDSETKGYLTTRTWDKKTAAEAFLEASKAHREAEKFVGAPADKLLRVPDERTTDTPETRTRHAEEWAKIHERLGKPKEAKEYDFSTVKRTGDKPLDEVLAATIRQAAFDANLNKDGAIKVAGHIVKHLDGVEAARAAEKADKLAEEKKELEKNWGANYNANKIVAEETAKRLARELGLPDLPAAVNALESSGMMGYSKIMEMFRNIGTKIGEDRFVSNNNQGGTVMTLDQAKAEKADLMKDTAWRDRYLKGGSEEVRKMTALNKIISGTA